MKLADILPATVYATGRSATAIQHPTVILSADRMAFRKASRARYAEVVGYRPAESDDKDAGLLGVTAYFYGPAAEFDVAAFVARVEPHREAMLRGELVDIPDVEGQPRLVPTIVPLRQIHKTWADEVTDDISIREQRRAANDRRERHDIAEREARARIAAVLGIEQGNVGREYSFQRLEKLLEDYAASKALV